MPQATFELIASRVDGTPIRTFSLAPGEYVLGRATDCQLPINAGSISRHHAKVRVTPEGVVTIEDLASANGVVLDEETIAGAREWKPGKVVKLGDARLEIRAKGG